MKNIFYFCFSNLAPTHRLAIMNIIVCFWQLARSGWFYKKKMSGLCDIFVTLAAILAVFSVRQSAGVSPPPTVSYFFFFYRFNLFICSVLFLSRDRRTGVVSPLITKTTSSWKMESLFATFRGRCTISVCQDNTGKTGWLRWGQLD